MFCNISNNVIFKDFLIVFAFQKKFTVKVFFSPVVIRLPTFEPNVCMSIFFWFSKTKFKQKSQKMIQTKCKQKNCSGWGRVGEGYNKPTFRGGLKFTPLVADNSPGKIKIDKNWQGLKLRLCIFGNRIPEIGNLWIPG